MTSPRNVAGRLTPLGPLALAHHLLVIVGLAEPSIIGQHSHLRRKPTGSPATLQSDPGEPSNHNALSACTTGC